MPFGAWGFETPGGYGERRWRAPPKWSGERCRESATLPGPSWAGGGEVRVRGDALHASVPRSPDCVVSPSGGMQTRWLEGSVPFGASGFESRDGYEAPWPVSEGKRGTVVFGVGHLWGSEAKGTPPLEFGVDHGF